MSNNEEKSSRQNVSREEFSAFQHHIDTQFSGVSGKFNSLEQSILGLGRKLDEGAKPNYSVMVSVGGLLLIIVGMGANLHGSQLKSIVELSNSQDGSLLERINYIENGSNHHSKSDQKIYEDVVREWQYRQDKNLEALQKEQSRTTALLDDNRDELSKIRGEWIQATTKQLHRLDEITRYHLLLDKPSGGGVEP